jgi:hypothetical protein
MRASRGLLATLGVSTCLVLAGTLALLSVSAVVAFRGWPGVNPGAVSAEPTQLAQVSVRPLPPASGRRSTDAIVIATRIVAAAHHRAASPPTPARHSGRIREVAEAVKAPAYPPTDVVAPTGPVVARPPTPAKPQVQETVDKVGGGLGATVKKTGDGLAQSVQPISPDLATTLDHVTETVGDAVEGLGGGVASLVAGLTP